MRCWVGKVKVDEWYRNSLENVWIDFYCFYGFYYLLL